MIIVAGHLIVDESDRADYLDACRPTMIAARSADGCLDFRLSADPIDDDRINVYEAWTSSGAADAFRATGPDDGLAARIRSADVHQHDVASSSRL